MRVNVATIAAVVTASVLGACVTINIYFPAAAAERAADRIIDEVWQLKPEGSKPNVNPLPAKPSTSQ